MLGGSGGTEKDTERQGEGEGETKRREGERGEKEKRPAVNKWEEVWGRGRERQEEEVRESRAERG